MEEALRRTGARSDQASAAARHAAALAVQS